MWNFSGQVEAVISDSLWHTVIYKFSVAHGHFKFSVAHGHFKFSVAHGHSEHNSFDASSFNPNGNHGLLWAPNFANSLCIKKKSFVKKSIKTRQKLKVLKVLAFLDSTTSQNIEEIRIMFQGCLMINTTFMRVSSTVVVDFRPLIQVRWNRPRYGKGFR